MARSFKDDLTADELKEIVSYDPDTGVFKWVKGRGGRLKGAVAGCRREGKARKTDVIIGINKYSYLAHRLAWLYVFGSFPNGVIDHINGDSSDNRIKNLRDVSQELNQQNRKSAQKNNKFGLLGVSIGSRGRIRATIQVRGKSKHLGHFKDVQSAHEAYLEAKRQLHLGNTL